MNEDGTPFNNVFDNILDDKKVIIIPNKITSVSNKAEITDPKSPLNPIKNMEITAIRVGNLPLQGTKLLVKIAIKRSRGESIILQPTIPAALQPNPMHMAG